MKTKPIILLLLISIFIYPFKTFSQNTWKIDEISSDLGEAFTEMYENAIIVQPKPLQTCDAKSLVNIVYKENLDVTHRLKSTLYQVISEVTPSSVFFVGDYDKGEFLTFQDKMMNAISISSNFNEFINNATGLDAAEITAVLKADNTESFEERLDVKDIDLFKNYYTTVSSLLDNWYDIDSENRAQYGVSSKYNVDLSPTKYMAKNDCVSHSKSRFRLKKLEYPKAIWEISTTVFVDCNCNENDSNTKVKSGVYEYSSLVEGLFTDSKVTYEIPKNPIITIKSLECCPSKEEPTETSLNDDEGINDLMQDQTIGFGAGIGFGQDFEETTWCVTAEYLYQINTDDYKGWYVGGEVTHSNTSFGDFSSNRTLAGAKIQHNISAVPSGETQFVVGLMANYGFGNTDNNGFKDDFTGTIFCAYGGANIRVSEDWSIGLQFPILIFENFTFKPESGGEFKTDATTLLINKNNPLKIIIRRRL